MTEITPKQLRAITPALAKRKHFVVRAFMPDGIVVCVTPEARSSMRVSEDQLLSYREHETSADVARSLCAISERALELYVGK